MATTQQLDGFQARIKRIKDPCNVSYYDAEMKMNVPKRVSKGFVNRKRVKRLGLTTVGVSGAMGGLAYVAVQVVSGRFGLLPSSELMLFGAAAILAIVLGAIMRHKTLLHMGAQLMGVAVMMTSAHNAVWMFPDAVSQVTSTAYVTQVQATTTPNSIKLLGATYTLTL
ncbi:MAG: hypothetical protein KC448_12095 [Yoonia sp.]|nr:hypothetical protein [Yoonia sp.]